MDAEFLGYFVVVVGITDEDDMVWVDFLFAEPLAAAMDFAFRPDVVLPQDGVEIVVDAMVQDIFPEVFVHAGGEDDLVDAALCELMQEIRNPVMQRTRVALVPVLLDEGITDAEPILVSPAKAKVVIEIPHRETEHAAVIDGLDRGEGPFGQDFADDRGAEVGVVDEGAVPIPDNVGDGDGVEGLGHGVRTTNGQE